MARKRQEGEYKRESLVTVELDSFQASLFAPEKLKTLEVQRPGVLAQAREDIITEQFIVTTRCTQGVWETVFQHIDGSTVALPESVSTRNGVAGGGGSPASSRVLLPCPGTPGGVESRP